MNANEQVVVGWLALAMFVLMIVWMVRWRKRVRDSAIRAKGPDFDDPKARFCPRCHYRGRPLWKVRGTFAVELLLYFFFVLPGIAYSLWRLTNKYTVCPECGEANMVPVTSPAAQAALGAPSRS